MSRRWNAARYVSIMVVSLAPAGAFAQVTASFQSVGNLPGGSFSSAKAVSPDGTVVVGDYRTDDQTYPWRAFRWTAATGMETLETSGDDGNWGVSAASAFGTIIVGRGPHYSPGVGDTGAAVLWGADGHVNPLASITLGGTPTNVATDVTPDGAVIVGSASGQGFRWSNYVVELLGGLNESNPRSEVTGVSADGSVIVGQSAYPGSREEAIRWTQETGMVGLGTLAGYPGSAAYGVSADGSTVVGQCSAAASLAFRWKDGAMTDLGGITADDYSSTAYATSSDGWRVVGKVQGNSGGEHAFIWDPVLGMRRIADVLTYDYGVDLEGWWLPEAFGISDDGQTIVGTARNPDGIYEGFVATIPSWTAYTIIKSDPPDGIIDARQDFSASGLTRRGFDRVRLTFATAFRDPATHGAMNVTNFSLADSLGNAPALVGVVPVPGDPTTFDILFEDPINPGAWSTLSLAVERPDGLIADAHVTIGFLPGDVNGDGTSAPVDILDLIDDLNHVRVPALNEWQCDIDRSALCAPPDILRLIDLLNGANTSRPWNGATLPPRP
ncbi:MAG: hypothetical protein Q7R41_05265 [Phycisphaerales bacterium]|nr:hypothetical protein [Phycisphaerales bacterium]